MLFWQLLLARDIFPNFRHQIITTSPTLRLRGSCLLCHLVFLVNEGRYSLIHLFQNKFVNLWEYLQRFWRQKSLSINNPGGNYWNQLDDPNRKWFRVKLSLSSGQIETWVKGWLLMTLAASWKYVSKASSLRVLPFRVVVVVVVVLLLIV